MGGKKKVLFVCVHNSARSQMAEELLRKIAGNRFEVESAGIEPGEVNPLTIKVLQEAGIDISRKKTNSAFDFHKQGKHYHYVVTVCSKDAEEKCPIYPGTLQRLHWPLEDPARAEGTEEQRLAKFREVRDQIRRKIESFADTFG